MPSAARVVRRTIDSLISALETTSSYLKEKGGGGGGRAPAALKNGTATDDVVERNDPVPPRRRDRDDDSPRYENYEYKLELHKPSARTTSEGKMAAAANWPQQQQQRSSKTTSAATRELDELMQSLNHFQVEPLDESRQRRRHNRDDDSDRGVQQQQQRRFLDADDPLLAGPSASIERRSATALDDNDEVGAANNQQRWQEQSATVVVSQQQQQQQLTRREENERAEMTNTCSACEHPVHGKVLTALGKTWHVECFRCHHCGCLLKDVAFYERHNKPYCENDYHELYSPKCAHCHKPILETCVTALGTTWHPHCFTCASCQRPFRESVIAAGPLTADAKREGFHERNGRPYCEECFVERFMPKCAHCHQPIRGQYVNALEKEWHEECFRCDVCNEPFRGGVYHEVDGHALCDKDFYAQRGAICDYCQTPINGRCITAMGKKFHPNHFVCSYCLKELNKGTFKEYNDRPWCHTCFGRLFPHWQAGEQTPTAGTATGTAGGSKSSQGAVKRETS